MIARKSCPVSVTSGVPQGYILGPLYLKPSMSVKLFTTLVQPTLNSVWGQAFILDQKKVEKVQRRATHCLATTC